MHPQRIPSTSELLQFFRKAGYRSLTPLQQRVIPLVLKGKDLAVQAAAGSGRTAAAVVSLIVGAKRNAASPVALAIVGATAEVEEFSRTWVRFSRLLRDSPALLALGEIDDVRREQRWLEKGGAVVVGTAGRVIDHIRRGSLSFDALSTVLVQAPDPADTDGQAEAPPGGTWATPGGAHEEFVRDTQFVFAKLPAHRQAVLFTRTPLDPQDELLGLLHRPTLLGTADLGAGEEEAREDLVVRLPGARSAEALAHVILGGGLRSSLVLHGPRTDGQALASGLRRALLRAEAVPAPQGLAARRRIAAAFAARELDVLVMPAPQGGLPAPADLDELRPTHVVFYDIPQVRGTPAARGARPGSPSAAERPAPCVVVLAADGQEKELARLQEAIGVSLNNGEVPGRDEVLGGAVRRIMERMQGEADQADLARVRAAVRRSVPLFQRTWFAAFLLKTQLLAGGAAPDQGRQREAGQRREARPTDRPPSRQGERQPRPERQPPQRAPLAPRVPQAPRALPSARATQAPRTPQAPRASQPPRGQRQARVEQPRAAEQAAPPSDGSAWTQLFVNIGRNRHVFAADLGELFTSTLGLAAGELGEVRVFDKYSFVEIAPARAADAIARVSGAQLKGRQVSVNYAKRKEEKEAR
jgi:ATP-dependent RNA helicase DeaD